MVKLWDEFKASVLGGVANDLQRRLTERDFEKEIGPETSARPHICRASMAYADFGGVGIIWAWKCVSTWRDSEYAVGTGSTPASAYADWKSRRAS